MVESKLAPNVIEEDRGNQNLQTQVNVNTTNIPTTISTINGLNECANLFQWVTSAILSRKLQLNEIQMEKFHGNVRQLHSDLQCLSDTLPAKYNLIDRAEWRIHDHCVADLLSRLKHAVYDAEDILDEFRWYETKLSVEGNAISMKPVIDFFHSVTQDSFNKVTDIQKRLNLLSGELGQMGLFQAVPRFDKAFRPETTSFLTEPKIFGRDEEKKKLIVLLGVPSERKRKRSDACSSASSQICATIDSNEATVSVPVLPIVGIGGVGKTTLAQDICSHSKVKCHFELIIWICVSDDFDVKRLTKEAIEQSCGKVPKNDNLNFLQGVLTKRLNNRRFLIVLDDMWEENDRDWKRFYAPFRSVLQGSMMLVTTRSPKVADVVHTMDPFPLEGLNKDVFQGFFKLCVFGSNCSNNYPELEQIGEKILPKLKGSPLAAKTLGRLLGMSLDLTHWERILMSQLWELGQEETDILPALRLSYMYLPFHLKRCFSFCAVYPKDYNFRKKDLAEIWLAEGLVEHEHTGDQYFEELTHLSFFQKYPRSNEKYVIHDLMHDMAQLVSKDECFIIKDTKDIPKTPQNVRHLFVLKGGDVQCSDLLNHDLARHRKLRTLLCDLPLKTRTGNSMMEKWCTELLCMRVMVCSSISKWGLPDSISNMKQLRYLKILNSSPCKSLPSGFYCLYNMQIFYAVKWEIDDIPSGFGMLINLQKFESVKCQLHLIHSVGILKGATDEGQRGQFKIKNYNGESLPIWFHPQNSEQIHSNNITSSTWLSLTDVEITDCRNLSNLGRFLQPHYLPSIKKIEISNCISLESVPTERFGDLHYLVVLRVTHCPKIKSRHLFSPSLKQLYLEDSGNLGCNIECSSLASLHLSNCFIESIVCNLRLLQEIEISSCPSLTVIRDSEPISSDILYGEARSRAIDNTFLSPTDVEITDSRNLSSMEIKISNCRSLELLPTDRFGYFRCLEVLSVSHCPKIKSRHLFAPYLKKLYLEDSGDLGYKIECSSLTILHLSNCRLESIELQMWNLPLLEEIEISSCPSLTVITGSELISSDILQQVALPIIVKIKISNCRSLESVPADRFGYSRFLEVLSVSNCPKIKSQHLFAPFLKELYLTNSGNLTGKIECSFLTTLQLSDCLLQAIKLQTMNLPLLQNLEIIRCSSLTSIRDSEPISTDLFHSKGQSRMGKFPLLANLTIISCKKLKTIDDLLYLPDIERIWIVDCDLLSLPAHILGSFPRLKEFNISACQSLNWQSGMVLPPSLQNLTLRNCGGFSASLPSCLENLTSLEWLEVRDCECIVSVPGHLWSINLRSLQRLEFVSCPKLKSIGGPGAIAHIKDLFISDCPELNEIDQPLRRGCFL